MWLQWLTRVMDRPPSGAGPIDDRTQTPVPTGEEVLPSDADIAAAQESILRFDELARAPAIL